MRTLATLAGLALSMALLVAIACGGDVGSKLILEEYFQQFPSAGGVEGSKS